MARLSEVVFENLKEMMKAKNAAHESMFKFHWKKMWPFSLIWPQVDYVRIVRFMGTLAGECEKQKAFIKTERAKAEKVELEFLDSVLPYLDALEVSCVKLAAAAEFKQDLLLKKIHHEARAIREAKRYNEILKAYEDAQANLVRAGALVRMNWGFLKQASAPEGAEQA